MGGLKYVLTTLALTFARKEFQRSGISSSNTDVPHIVDYFANRH